MGLPLHSDVFGSRAELIEHNQNKYAYSGVDLFVLHCSSNWHYRHDIAMPTEHYDFFYLAAVGRTRPLATVSINHS